MTPIGAGLQEPVVICWPFVMGKLGSVRQKLMKLFDEVREAICPRRRSLLSVLLKARSNDLGIKRCERKKKTINIKLKKN